MAQVTYPGVYVEEVPSGARPIAAASTSIAAFIGVAERGSIGEAVKVFNFTEYQNRYGGFIPNSFLSHAVYQFFNNSGTQCYIVRVAGVGATKANIVLRDRAATSPQASLTISASSPGAWGNQLAVVIANGLNDPVNEFNLAVFRQDELTPLERFDNLSMIPGAPNFVEVATASSRYIQVTVNAANTDAQAGTSRGAGAPQALTSPKTRLCISINGDGFQEIDLQTAAPTPAPDLNTADNIAIQARVRALTKLRASTDQNAFANFLCQVNSGVLLLTSGVAGVTSSVKVAPAANSAQDATVPLRLGQLSSGVETLGGAVLRPRTNPPRTPPDNYYLIGDNIAPTTEVASVVLGSDGSAITTDQPYIDAFTTLDDKEDVSLVAVPGIGSASLVGAGMNYCANRSLTSKILSFPGNCMFSPFSRYRKLPDVVTTDAKGRTLASKALRLLPSVSGVFQHTIEDGDRLDPIAYKYYRQPTKWWRISDANPEFLSPQALLGKEPIVTDHFSITFNGSQPPWATLIRSLSAQVGIEMVTVVETIQLAPESRTVGNTTVTVQAERFERAVAVTYNQLNITTSTIRNLIIAAGFVVGQPERASRVGQQIIIPQDSVG